MKLYYSTKKIERILCDNRQIKKYYPREYNKIVNRLSELVAANNLSEIPHVPPPRRHKLSGDKDGYWGIDYSPNFRIIIKPVNEFNIDDLTTMTDIMVMGLEDYH